MESRIDEHGYYATLYGRPASSPDVKHLFRIPVMRMLTRTQLEAILPLQARDPWLVQLAGSNPALFCLLVNSIVRHHVKPRTVHLLVRQRRAVQLRLLGLRAEPCVERFLRRCGISAWGDVQANALREACSIYWEPWMTHWRLPHMLVLSRIRHGNWQAAAVAMDAVLLTDPACRLPDGRVISGDDLFAFLPDVCVEVFAEIAELCRMIDSLWLQSEVQAGMRVRLAHCRSRADLRVLHERFLGEGRRDWLARVRACQGSRGWPAPPFPGNDHNEHIVAIDSAEMLAEEGDIMRHCIPTYARAILAGEGYAWRVLAPQRATAYAVPAPDGVHWHLQEIRLVRNELPLQATEDFFCDWLQAAAAAHASTQVQRGDATGEQLFPDP